MVAVVMDSHLAGGGREIIGEGDKRRLSGWSPNRQTGVGSAVSPHIGARPIQKLHTGRDDVDRHVRVGCGGRERQWTRKRDRRWSGGGGRRGSRSRCGR